jgi:hypothetical protein
VTDKTEPNDNPSEQPNKPNPQKVRGSEGQKVRDSADQKAAGGRPRDAVMDALALVETPDSSQMTEPAWGRCAKARSIITGVWPDKTTLPAEIERRAVNLSLLFPQATPTVMSLAGHWAECDKTPPQRGLPFDGQTARPIESADKWIRPKTPTL